MNRTYNSWRRRNSIKSLPGKSNIQSKKYLISIKGFVCNECNRVFNKHNGLYLDHIIPVSLQGDEFNIDNHQLLCGKCHNIKTQKDLFVLRIFKKFGLVTGSHQCWHSYLTKEEFNYYRRIFYDLVHLKKEFDLIDLKRIL